MLFGVVNRHFARHTPVAHGRKDFKIGGKRSGCHFKPNLVVALPRATMSNRIGAMQTSRFNEMLHDDWTRQRRDEWVLTLVERVCFQRRGKELIGELLATIHHACFDCACSKRFCL